MGDEKRQTYITTGDVYSEETGVRYIDFIHISGVHSKTSWVGYVSMKCFLLLFMLIQAVG